MEPEQSIQEFLEFVIGGLIQHGDRATITHRHEEGSGLFYFDATLDPEDVGRIIGKNGFVISSIRSLLDAAAEKHGIKVRFKAQAEGE